MNRFYATGAPHREDGLTQGWLKSTLKEAVDAAQRKVSADEAEVMYVVQIVRKVERSKPPVRVTVVK